MEMTFSLWLRDTARLYVRYVAIGAASIPFAIAYALAKQAGWHSPVLVGALAGCALATAGVIWKRLELPPPAPAESKHFLSNANLRLTELLRAAQSQEIGAKSCEETISRREFPILTINWDEMLLEALKKEAALVQPTRTHVEQMETLRQIATPVEGVLLRRAQSQRDATLSATTGWIGGMTSGRMAPQPAAQLI